MDAVYEFSAVRFLNAVSYLKAKDLYEKEINKTWQAKAANKVHG